MFYIGSQSFTTSSITKHPCYIRKRKDETNQSQQQNEDRENGDNQLTISPKKQLPVSQVRQDKTIASIGVCACVVNDIRPLDYQKVMDILLRLKIIWK